MHYGLCENNECGRAKTIKKRQRVDTDFLKGEKKSRFLKKKKPIDPRVKSLKIMTYIKSGGPACS